MSNDVRALTNYILSSVFWLITATMLIACPSDGWATSCIRGISTLADRYSAADAIVVAHADSCAQVVLPTSRCQDEEFKFSVLEVLKEPQSAHELGGSHKGSTPFGCGLVFVVGYTYLLYLDDNGEVIHSSSGYVDEEDPDAALATESVRILREFRDGTVQDLSDPWSFWDSGLTCELQHVFGGASISILFDYRPKQFWDSTLIGVEGAGPNGEALFRLEKRSERRPREQMNTTVEYDGPEILRETIYVQVRLRGRRDSSDGAVTVSVGNRTWSSHPQTITTSGSMVSTHIYVMDLLAGDDALELVDALRAGPQEISVRTSSAKADSALAYPDLAHTKNTQFAHAIGSFDRCMDGSARRGSRISQ